MDLTLEIIESYGFDKTTTKPDWNDVQNNYTLPNGIELSAMTVCNNEPCSSDLLEGLEGFICIGTKEELDALLIKTFEEVCKDIAAANEDFDIDDYC